MSPNDTGVDQYQSVSSENGPVRAEDTIIPVIHEEVMVSKKKIDTVSVYISKTVKEQQQEINIPLISEQYSINRISVNQVVATPPPAIRHEGDTMIISVLKEVLVVEKKYEIIEEIHVTKQTSQTTETQHIMVRKEEVIIERTPINEGSV